MKSAYGGRMRRIKFHLKPKTEGFIRSKIGNNDGRNKLADMSTKYVIIEIIRTDEGHYAISNQLERSAASIGANIREAKYAHSKLDFITK